MKRIGGSASARVVSALLLPAALGLLCPAGAEELPHPRAGVASSIDEGNRESPEERLQLLEAKCAALQEEHAALAGELADSLARLAGLMPRLGESQSLKNEKKQLLAEHATLRELLAVAEGRIKAGEELAKQRLQESLAARDDDAECAVFLADAVASLEAGDDERDALRKNLELRDQEAQVLQTRIDEVEGELVALEAFSREAKIQEEATKDRAAELEREKSEWEMAAREDRGTIARQQEQIAELDKELLASRQKLAALAPLEDQVKAQRDALADREKEIAKTKKRLESAERKVAELAPLEDKVKEQRDALADREKEIAKTSKRLASAERKVAELASLEDQVKAQRDALTDREKEIARTSKRLESAERKVAELAPLEDKVKEQRDALADREKEIAKTSKRLESAERKVTELAPLEKRVEEQQKTLDSQGKEVARLGRDLEAAEKGLSDSQNQAQALSKTRDTLVRKVKESVMGLLALQVQISGLERELRTFKEMSAARPELWGSGALPRPDSP